MDRSLVEREAEPREIVVVRVKRHWVVRTGGEDIAVVGGKSEAVDRACSIAQLGDGLRDVVVFGSDGSIEERRCFGL
jgi:hypothetical protein